MDSSNIYSFNSAILSNQLSIEITNKIQDLPNQIDLANDQQELINLKLEHREIFAKLRSKYQLWESELEPY